MANPEFRAASAVVTVPSSGNGAASVAKPAGVVDGDYVFIFVLDGNNGSAATATPAGFGTPLLEADNWAFGCGARVFGKIASSDPASYALSAETSTTPGKAFAVAFSNPNAAPINASAIGAYANAANPVFPTLNATLAGKYVGLVVAFNNSNVTITAAGAMVSRLAQNTAISFMVADEEITAGSISGRAATAPAVDYFTLGFILAGAGATADTTPPDITSTGTGSTNGPFAVNVAENSTAVAVTLTSNEALGTVVKGGADGALFTLAGSGLTRTLAPTSAFNFESLPHANPFVVTLNFPDTASPPNERTVTINFTVTNVNEPPGAPTIGTAVAGNASASVAFTPPAANGGPSPTSYTATSSPGGITGTGASSPITVSGLTNGTPYTFTVTATNSEGTGSPSAASNSVTPTAGGDSTPPTLTSPSGTGGQMVCSGSVSTNEGNGTLYAVATASATAPSANQVKLGQNHLGAAALRVVSQAVSATGVQNIASGPLLSEGTRYWHFMHEDAANNQSAVVSSASFNVTSFSVTIGPFGNNTGLGQRAPGEQYVGWLFPGVQIGQSMAGVTPVLISGTLNGSGLAAVTGLTAGGPCEVQVRFPDDPGAEKGTARTQATAV